MGNALQQDAHSVRLRTSHRLGMPHTSTQKASTELLSVYVDDFKMAGRKDYLAPVRAKLGKHLELEPPTPFDGNICLGSGQSNITPPPPSIVAEKQMLYKKLFAKNVTGLFKRDASPADLSDYGTTICTAMGGKVAIQYLLSLIKESKRSRAGRKFSKKRK